MKSSLQLKALAGVAALALVGVDAASAAPLPPPGPYMSGGGNQAQQPAPRGNQAAPAGQQAPGGNYGGPGGWVILDEPELHLGADVLVPDLAGWRIERATWPEDAAYIDIAPD